MEEMGSASSTGTVLGFPTELCLIVEVTWDVR